MVNIQKEIQSKLVKKLLDIIVLQFLRTQSMHGYELIAKIKKTLGVSFGPSTVYPLLSSLEKKACITSVWNMEGDRPKKVYSLTDEGQSVLISAENALSLICQRMSPFSENAAETSEAINPETDTNTNTL
ncbi:MAG: PadR family transcriptional regulator [Candidatus Bathyarchaeota archaeon]|nr:PadR family transcriptional regulator [Candidatus Termiticorpusculum sp.]